MSVHPKYRLPIVVLLSTTLLLLVSGGGGVQGAVIESYPLAWSEIDFRPMIDNDRLFKKYKECLISDKPRGCPRDIIQFKSIVLEAINTDCAKCLPQHMKRVKEAIDYICQTRTEDFNEVRSSQDPDGKLKAKFEEKYGKLLYC